MWIATTRGFYSAVQHRDTPDLLVVRTRDRSDAESLRDWYQEWIDATTTLASLLGDTPAAHPQATITTYEWSDYPWRVIMPRTAWASFIAEAAEDLDYGNFKDAVKSRQGADRANVYMGVWSVLTRLEDLDPHGRVREPEWDTEPWGEYDTWEALATTCGNCGGSGMIDTTPQGARHPALQSDTECPVCDGTGEALDEPQDADENPEAPTSMDVTRWLENHA